MLCAASLTSPDTSISTGSPSGDRQASLIKPRQKQNKHKATISMQTLNIKFMVTQSLKLRAYFHIQIKFVFQQLFFLSSPCKTSESILVFEKVLHYSHPQDTHFFFKNPFCCVLIYKIFEGHWWLFLSKAR